MPRFERRSAAAPAQLSAITRRAAADIRAAREAARTDRRRRLDAVMAALARSRTPHHGR